MTAEPCQRREHVPRRSSLVVAKQVFFEVGGAVLWRGSVVPFRGGFMVSLNTSPSADAAAMDDAAQEAALQVEETSRMAWSWVVARQLLLLYP